MSKVRTIVLRTAGTNCDKETAFAFEKAGASAELVHINELTRRRKDLGDYDILAIPGGFTYGDDISSGKILANELKFKLEGPIEKFLRCGKLIIGICNGFQVLVKSGLLPNLGGDAQTIEATLTLNDSDKFEDRWVYLKMVNGKGDSRRAGCVWTEGMDNIIRLPVAHGEGKFIPKDAGILKRMKEKGLIVLEYVDSGGKRAPYPFCPNGSVENIAGICDPTGRVFGLMPHPERHVSPLQHPEWTKRGTKRGEGDGFAIFRNGVGYARRYL